MYGQSQALQQQGAGMYADLMNSDIARRYQGANALMNQTTSAQQQQLNAAQMMQNFGNTQNQNALQALQQLPAMYQYGLQPAQTLMGVGGAYENLGQQLIDADRSRWDFNQQSNMNMLGWAANIMNGLPVATNTTATQTSPIAKTNRAMGAMGGALAGAQMGSAIPGIGTGIGAGVGALMGLFGGG
jgi:hypothetical protein